MPLDKLEESISNSLEELKASGRLKGEEDVIAGIKRPEGGKGPRYLLEGDFSREFIKMDSNSYLGLSLDEEVIRAGEKASAEFGAGPGSVRFIHGTCRLHRELEKKLALFHGREAAVIFSSAYSAVCGVLSPLISNDTVVISDALNHNSIINAARMSRPGGKKIYRHLDMDDLEKKLEKSAGAFRRALIVTDGVFSMRGDYPDLKRLVKLAEDYNSGFEEGVITVMDDSHGTGAYGETGRGTSEVCGEYGADIIISTLGKALGVNGGYAVSSGQVVRYLRETSPFYIYSNPVTPGEAGAALKALEILDSGKGRELIGLLSGKVRYFKRELAEAGCEVLEGIHPVVAVMIRDGSGTDALVGRLRENGVLAVGLKHPVVPGGDECVRLQVNACHTEDDIKHVLEVMKDWMKGG